MTDETVSNEALSDAVAAELSAPGHRPALTLDVALYENYLTDSDLSEDQKREFLETLWSIIVAFVDLGFGVHPLQQASEACGQNSDLPSSAKDDVVSSDVKLPKNRFSEIASPRNDGCAGRTDS